jgi:hypothetical protein
MSETAAPIGLSWAPKLPSFATTSGGSKSDVDGLFVPPRDPRQLNKLAKKNVKDTTGKGW